MDRAVAMRLESHRPLLAAPWIGAVVFLVSGGDPRRSRARADPEDVHQLLPTDAHHLLTHHECLGLHCDGSTPPNCVSGMGVVPRDTCNGIESSTNPPGYYYWDGTIILAPDGTYHLFAEPMGRLPGIQPRLGGVRSHPRRGR